jgi:hypothetical protein
MSVTVSFLRDKGSRSVKLTTRLQLVSRLGMIDTSPLHSLYALLHKFKSVWCVMHRLTRYPTGIILWVIITQFYLEPIRTYLGSRHRFRIEWVTSYSGSSTSWHWSLCQLNSPCLFYQYSWVFVYPNVSSRNCSMDFDDSCRGLLSWDAM